MKNNVLKIILGTVVVTIIISAVSMLSSNSFKSSQKPITELNQTYYGERINVTATEIKCLDLPNEETAKLLGIGMNKMYELLANHSIPSKRIGRKYLIPRLGLEQWLCGNQPEVQYERVY